MDAEDREHLAQLLNALRPLDGWLARIDPAGSRSSEPAPRSPLAGDDRRTHPYQLSHAAWISLSHAVDHLSCLRSLITKAGLIHMYAPYTVVRAALENAATAIWLLAPDRRPERILRRLQLAVYDLRNGDQFLRVLGQPRRRPFDEQMTELLDLARARGFGERDAKAWPGLAKIVEAGGAATRVGGTLALVIWKACSGIAHGDLWATLSVMERTEIWRDEKLTHQRVEASVKVLSTATRVAADLTATGWQLYDKRGTCPY